MWIFQLMKMLLVFVILLHGKILDSLLDSLWLLFSQIRVMVRTEPAVSPDSVCSGSDENNSQEHRHRSVPCSVFNDKQKVKLRNPPPRFLPPPPLFPDPPPTQTCHGEGRVSAARGTEQQNHQTVILVLIQFSCLCNKL